MKSRLKNLKASHLSSKVGNKRNCVKLTEIHTKKPPNNQTEKTPTTNPHVSADFRKYSLCYECSNTGFRICKRFLEQSGE